MKFYNREDELALLKKAENLKNKRAIFSLIIGRRRVGKTALARQVNANALYFFISKKDEKLLCEEFTEELASQGFAIFGTFEKFEDLFAYILHLSQTQPLTLILDEFQDFYKIDPSIFSSIQKLWDRYKDNAKLHLIVCGSVYSLMKKIFENEKEPLFGRVDFKIDLQPFNIMTLRQFLLDYDAYTPQNLLDFYTITGGVAKYVELMALYEAFTFTRMVEEIVSPLSLFLDEGKNRLIEEFGKEYATYFSILSLIASSKTSRSEIESVLQKNISGHLERLEKDYSIIKAIKPIDAKPNAKLQKYEIVDNFLSFWFRFIYKYQSYIEAENYEALKRVIHRDYPAYRGRFLEKLFIELLKQKGTFTKIGRYWERGNKNEIDIVAIDEELKKILIAEVKSDKKRANKAELATKAAKLLSRYKGYEVNFAIFGIEDIESFNLH